jgi:hypothetical protein
LNILLVDPQDLGRSGGAADDVKLDLAQGIQRRGLGLVQDVPDPFCLVEIKNEELAVVRLDKRRYDAVHIRCTRAVDVAFELRHLREQACGGESNGSGRPFFGRCAHHPLRRVAARRRNFTDCVDCAGVGGRKCGC